jgi:hypothetical protein
MFIGHFGVGFASKRFASRVPLILLLGDHAHPQRRSRGIPFTASLEFSTLVTFSRCTKLNLRGRTVFKSGLT